MSMWPVRMSVGGDRLTVCPPRGDTSIRVGDNAAEHSMAKRAFVSEVACALRLSDRAAETLIGQSQSIVADLPLTRAALRSGAMSYKHAQSMVDHCAGLPPEQRSAVEGATVHRAASTTTSQFERRVRIARESLAPESSIERAKRAVERRTVDLSPERDGMAWISALLPAVDALAIFDRLTGAARSFQNDGDPRTLPQLRADILRSCLLDDDAIVLAGHPVTGGSGEIRRFRGIRPHVLITVPVLTLLGRRTADSGVESASRRVRTNRPRDRPSVDLRGTVSRPDPDRPGDRSGSLGWPRSVSNTRRAPIVVAHSRWPLPISRLRSQHRL
jgi:Domain of unknown function (DUF222)